MSEETKCGQCKKDLTPFELTPHPVMFEGKPLCVDCFDKLNRQKYGRK